MFIALSLNRSPKAVILRPKSTLRPCPRFPKAIKRPNSPPSLLSYKKENASPCSDHLLRLSRLPSPFSTGHQPLTLPKIAPSRFTFH